MCPLFCIILQVAVVTASLPPHISGRSCLERGCVRAWERPLPRAQAGPLGLPAPCHPGLGAGEEDSESLPLSSLCCTVTCPGSPHRAFWPAGLCSVGQKPGRPSCSPPQPLARAQPGPWSTCCDCVLCTHITSHHRFFQHGVPLRPGHHTQSVWTGQLLWLRCRAHLL